MGREVLIKGKEKGRLSKKPALRFVAAFADLKLNWSSSALARSGSTVA